MINPSTLRHHRALAGLSQRGLAKAAGLGPLGIKRIEDGADASRLPLAVVSRIADATGVTIDQLLDQSSPTPGRDAGHPGPQPLTYHQAKLLRRLQRGDDITRRMTRADRELVLPQLLRANLVNVTTEGLSFNASAQSSLTVHPVST